MNSAGEFESRHGDFDVVIAGAGLAGLTLAKQLRQQLPQLRVALIDRLRRPLPEAAHKVGESSVELGSRYLESLGLRSYLLEHHIVKFGLRFFPGGGQLPVSQRTELGPTQEPPVRSYQLDRGRLENDLRELNANAGVEMFEGYLVRAVELSTTGGQHEIRLEPAARSQDAAENAAGHTTQPPAEPCTLKARWFVDATGRTGLLRRKLKLRRGTNHAANAGWFRVKGRLDVTEFVSQHEAGSDNADTLSAWREQPFADNRWRSTNHFMGRGYWVWFIPLSSGNTSVGIVTHDEYHSFDEVRTLDRAMQFLRKHEPHLVPALESAEVMDFRCLNGYSHNAARCWSDQRWAMVGEAGAFVDPLYSPGTDFIAFANSFTGELIRADLAGEDLTTRVRELNLQYRALVLGAVAVFRTAAEIYGHARAMAAKIYWDNFAYWCFPCQYFLQELYRQTGPKHVELTLLGSRFVELSGYVQALLGAWVKRHPAEPEPGFIGLPVFPSLLVDAHLDLQKKLTVDETMELFKLRVAQGEDIVRELVIRVVAELGPQAAVEVLQDAQAGNWDLGFSPERIAAESLRGVPRRHALSEVARDVERNLGRVPRHPAYEEALAQLVS